MEAQQASNATSTRTKPLSWDEQYGEGSDTTLHLTSDTGERSFKVHKWILRYASEYFRALFFGSMTDSKLTHFTIMEPCSDLFETFLELIYRRQVKIDSLAVGMELYIMADKYICPDAFAYCSQYLIGALDVDNAKELNMLAERHHDKKLEAACKNVRRQHLNHMLTNGSLETLDFEASESLVEESAWDLFVENGMDNEPVKDICTDDGHVEEWCMDDEQFL